MLLVDPNDTYVFDFIDENEVIRNLGGSYTSREETLVPKETYDESSLADSQFDAMKNSQRSAVNNSFKMDL